MTWEPEPETAIRIGWTVSFLAFLVFVISAIGEYRGWWGLIGQIGMVFGSVASAMGVVATVVYAAEKGQVDGVHRAVEENGTRLVSMDDKLDELDAIKHALVGEDGAVRLERIERALAGEDGMVRGLDALEMGLDAQTGVLDEQSRVLRQIRDRL